MIGPSRNTAISTTAGARGSSRSGCRRATRCGAAVRAGPGADRTEVTLAALGHVFADDPDHLRRQDRKSTRLNSSHVAISYAVFCLKKKKKLNSSKILST